MSNGNQGQINIINQGKQYSDIKFLHEEMIELQLPFDQQNFLVRHRLSELDRMSIDDQERYINKLQVIKRLSVLEMDKKAIEYPEFKYKSLHNKIIDAYNCRIKGYKTIDFKGNTFSELNDFIKDKDNVIVSICVDKIKLDQPLNMKSNIIIDGNRSKITIHSKIEKAILFDNVKDAGIMNFVLNKTGDYAVFLNETNNISIINCEITNENKKGVALIGDNSNFLIYGNIISNNVDGGLFINGKIHDGLIKKNVISYQLNSSNFSPGILLGAVEVKDNKTAYNKYEQRPINELTEAPHNMVIIDNQIFDNYAQGIYIHGGYNIYIVRNKISNNHKEGVCLDFGTSYCYVSKNVFDYNGHRKDIIRPGTEYYRLPGISLDNAAYNLIYNNIFSNNSGSGIKAVRSSVANIVMCNTVTDNNIGQNEKAHFFGIELSATLRPDIEGQIDLDFAPCYENIIASNIVWGSHYAGLFIGRDCYINDVFDNTIMGSIKYSIECKSEKLNNMINNNVDINVQIAKSKN